MKYLPRIIDDEITAKMQSSGCVWIEGCKWCGKSTTGRRHASSVVEFQDVDMKATYDAINLTKPSLFLNHERPLMIDEWQMYPIVWDAIRNDVDRTGEVNQFIITGSARPADGRVMHSGTGRISSVLMRPMSLAESGESDGKISLRALFEGDAQSDIVSNLTFDNLVQVILRGGWPQAVANDVNGAAVAGNYINRLTHEGVDVVGVNEYNPDRMRAILRSVARNISSPLNTSTIMADIDADRSISRNTLDKYLATLKSLYIIESVPAWNGRLRSKTVLRTKDKMQLVDPSLAASALGATAMSLHNDLNTLGLLFESSVVRDLRVYADNLGGKVYYYRDETDLEVDAIIVLPNGDWGAVEIKLGSGYIPMAERNLLTMRNRIDTDKVGQPKFLVVVTGEQYSYRLPSGVRVVSVGNLGK